MPYYAMYYLVCTQLVQLNVCIYESKGYIYYYYDIIRACAPTRILLYLLCIFSICYYSIYL